MGRPGESSGAYLGEVALGANNEGPLAFSLAVSCNDVLVGNEILTGFLLHGVRLARCEP